jgi:hypothetical protein
VEDIKGGGAELLEEKKQMYICLYALQELKYKRWIL